MSAPTPASAPLANAPAADFPSAAINMETRAGDRVPLGTKVSFGLGNMVGMATGNLNKELLNPVYVVGLGLSPALIGVAMIVFRIYDAITDPLMGWISDNTRTRWGRRRPWMFLGAFLCALAMPLMWLVQPGWSPTVQTAWLIGAGLLLYTCSTIYGVPYESFSLELTPDYKERTRVASFRMVISSVGGLVIGWSWFITQLPMFSDPETGKPDTLAGALGLSVALGLIIIAAGLFPVFFARERFYKAASKQTKVSLKSNFAATLHSRPFLILVGIALCAVTAGGLAGGIGFFTRLYYVCSGDTALAAKITGIQATFWMPISIASVFAFQTISSRWSKTHSLSVALVFCFGSVALRWWSYTPEMPYLSLTPTFLLAVGTTGMWQLLPSMNADVVDSDELHTSARREGAFAAIFSWFMKLSFTAGIGLPGVIVAWCGFVVAQQAEQLPSIMINMRLAEILIPAALLAISLVLLAIYPLSVRRMGEIRRDLEARRGRL